VNIPHRPTLGRRTFLKAMGVAGMTAATGLGARQLIPGLGSAKLAGTYSGLKIKRYHIAASDGWVAMPPGSAALPPYFPDPMAPSYTQGQGYYAMGFRDVTSYAPFSGDPDKGDYPVNAAIMAEKNKMQIAAPILFARVGEDLRLHLVNLGLANRPDLVDPHTIHFHGFPNQTAYFDGVPDASLAAPPGRSLSYRYIPQDPGTYMWHCHVEDVEHVHMGLTGVCFVLPAKGPNYAYDYEETRFDRQFAMILTEADVRDHYNDAHLQINDFSTWSPSFQLMNGRAWPDTILANINPATGSQLDGAPMSGSSLTRLRYNPISSLIQANSGEKVLVRLSNLGYQEHSLVMPGVQFRVIGRDAKPLVSGRSDYLADPPGVGLAYAAGSRPDISWYTDRVDLGPGESRDLLFTAPTVNARTVFPFYDRNGNFDGPNGVGSMRTEVHVFPAGSLPAQPQGSTMDVTATNPGYTPNQLFTSGGAM
jgi:FtsP/CotA-like multicopper oxidase with cupredoxin domain